MIPAETEAHFQAEVVKFAHMVGWRSYHTYDARRSSAGFPDLVLVHAGDRRVIFAELKRDNGKETAAQRAWLDDLADCGMEVYTWRPRDWPEIVKVLR